VDLPEQTREASAEERTDYDQPVPLGIGEPRDINHFKPSLPEVCVGLRRIIDRPVTRGRDPDQIGVHSALQYRTCGSHRQPWMSYARRWCMSVADNRPGVTTDLIASFV
jgi:hypothetical protein